MLRTVEAIAIRLEATLATNVVRDASDPAGLVRELLPWSERSGRELRDQIDEEPGDQRGIDAARQRSETEKNLSETGSV